MLKDKFGLKKKLLINKQDENTGTILTKILVGTLPVYFPYCNGFALFRRST